MKIPISKIQNPDKIQNPKSKQIKNSLSVANLHVTIEEKEILHGITLQVNSGEVHVIMGPNGSGKSTLTYALMGHPNYKISNSKSQIQINRKSIKDLEPNERAKMGLLLAFQNPISIPGVTLSSFLRSAYTELYGKNKMSVLEFHNYLHEQAKKLDLAPDFLRRAINEGFSGGEKKKAEMLQLLVLKPRFAIFDEIDTGLDVDALKIVANGIELLKEQGTGILLITHYQRILNYVALDRVHIMRDGQIVKTGGKELVKHIEEKGYGRF